MLQKRIFKSGFILVFTLFFTLLYFQHSVFGADKDILTKEEAIEAYENITFDNLKHSEKLSWMSKAYNTNLTEVFIEK